MNIEKAIIKEYADKPIKEIVDAPVWAIKGISQSDAVLLEQAFGVKTVGDFANLKYFKWAQAIVSLSEVEV
ncbi:MAG: hypothetical protein F6K40_01010 [Okeania sp. SIO3I5]|uniref:hypothetical protein n=1 Tax=Okeania sp. SIO3I5 TaxID=2607805 RepID=UPI0013B7E71D|nr:hypothetical protein [Okeania sp. SIO3I5]NEQ34962.1 hypothetical protein [Okeania sp. SIO3I5]